MSKLFRGIYLFSMLCALCSAFCICAANAECDIRGVEKDAPVLCGVAAQGGFLYGELDENWNVYGGDEKISMNGIFVMGLDRDMPEFLQMRFCKSSGRALFGKDSCEVFTYKIKQRTYGEQKITVAKEFDELSPKDQKRADAESAMVQKARARAINLDATGFLDMELPDNLKPQRISGVFGTGRIVNGNPRRPHYGVDIASPRGTKVGAVADGIVIVASDMFYSGNTVIVSHGHGITTSYLHMDGMNVKAGDVVTRGDKVGVVGSTGRSTGPHLHLGAHWRNVAIDPQLVISFGEKI
ncbi:MAG: M23 family metallopeptidase [Alphaproteobacteria bacterium]|nr:M23 family metallopeptidase [Alphaproteobacteria bacterium]